MSRFLIIFLLSVLLSRKSLSSPLTDCSCLTDNTNEKSYIFDDGTVLQLKKQVELLNTSNEILRMRLEGITLRLDTQTEILNTLSAKLGQHVDFDDCDNKKPIIDIRTGVLNEPNEHAVPNRTIYPNSCAEAAAVKRRSGLYTIQVPLFSAEPFLAFCDEEAQGGGWTVIQRRVDETIDFFRDWNSYKIGFGNLEGNFFIGLDKLHAITTTTPQELLVVMTDFDGATKFAKYDSFAIGNESEMYALNVLGKYSGDAGDSLTYHVGYKFTTKDKKNDINSSNCAEQFKGAWWYKNCHASNLNGLYLKGTYGKEQYAQGVDWSEWRGHYYSLKSVKMLIRPKRY